MEFDLVEKYPQQDDKDDCGIYIIVFTIYKIGSLTVPESNRCRASGDMFFGTATPNPAPWSLMESSDQPEAIGFHF